MYHSSLPARLLQILILLCPLTAAADWQYDYYEGNWSVLPDFDLLTPVASGTALDVSVAPRLRNDQFGFRFRNQISVAIEGNYQFATNSDDGSQLLIDAAVVVNNDGLHGPTMVSATIFLAVGTYDIEVTHFEQGGGEIIEASYAPPGAGLRSIPATGVLAGPDQLAETGSWGPVIPWPHVPVSAANMPDGRVITWASNERYSFPGGRPEFTYTGIWDPTDNSITEIDHPSHDMFCAHVVMLENGQVFVSGGRNSGSSPWTSVFDSNTDQWVPLSNMNRGRWYPSSLALADGKVFTAIGSGGGNTGEFFDPDTGNWQILGGLNFDSAPDPADGNILKPVILGYPGGQYGEREWWPLFGLMPDGNIFHAGPTPQMHVIDINGSGQLTRVGTEFTDWYPKHGATVMYDEGEMITAGGWVNGTNIASTNEAYTIDLNGPSPVVVTTNPMINPRKFHNGVMLPNGEVLMVGGNTSGQKFNDTGSIYTTEIWNPISKAWREGAAMSVPRNYHSIALMLTDGTVLSAGGGLCNCSADHANGQIYTPPYLYNVDGSPATRPKILTAPAAIRAGDVFDVTTDADITHFSVIKMSSTTHAVNTDLRYLSVPFSGGAGNYQLTANSNPNVLTPGYWMLFALNAIGTPSVAKVIQVRAANDGDLPIATANFDFLGFADLGAFQLNGSAVGTGGALRLTTTVPNSAGSVFYRNPLILDSTTAFSTSFEFSSSGVADGAAGLAFVVQGNENTTLGESGSGLGYRFVPNSLAIEFDTANDAAGDIDGNHIAVHVAGDSETPLATVSAPFDLEDGAVHRAWVEYSAALDELTVYVSADPGLTRPATPVLTVGSFDLVATVGSLGYFGFSGSTAGLTNNHDIHAWSMAVTTGTSPINIVPIVAPPQPGDGPVSFSASATGVGLEYSWSFGDGSPPTAFDVSPDVTYDYGIGVYGRYVVTLTVRDINGVEQTYQFIQAVYPPPTVQQPVSSTTIIVENVTGLERVWNVNPDNNTVTVINGVTNLKIAEIAVGNDPRALMMAPNATVWVTNKDDATISIVDANTFTVTTRSLPPGSRPHGIVAHESSGNVYVALEQLGVVRKLDMIDAGSWLDVDVGPNPRHLSVTGNESRLYVSRFISPPFPDEYTLNPQTSDVDGPAGGEVLAVDPSTMNLLSTIVLQYSSREPAEITGPGFPNYLGPPIISPSGDEAWVPSKQDDILRGQSRNGEALVHDHTVRAVTSVIDLATETELPGLRVDHDNSSTARNGTFDPNGVFLYVALEGNRQVVVVDPFTYQEVLRFDVEFAPQSVATSSDGTKVYVHNFMSRSVSIVDVADLINGMMPEAVGAITSVSTTAGEALSAQVLLGKQLFYDARDPRLSLESYMSCASCHNDGGQDGRVWDLSSMGEGLRNTISLKGHGGMSHGPLHWSANFDEVQDFENQIRALAGGTGLMSPADFTATQELLGAPKAGLSTDLDALAGYLASLNTIEQSPFRNADGSLTAEGLAGKALFAATGCADCHSGPAFSDSAPGVRHNIGTITLASGRRLGDIEDPITAIDTPTLLGLWSTAPYLHDGSAQTLQDAILAHDAVSLGGASFTTAELNSLVSYVQQIDQREVIPSVPVWQSQDIGAVAAAGSFAESGGTLTLTASGWDIWDAADEFHFAYQSLTGDGEVVARVSSFTASHQWAKAGVMIRESLATNSQHAMMMVTPSSNGAGLHARLSAGLNSTATSGGSGNAPYWVRLVRAGDTLTGYKSTDGVSWVEVDQMTIPMSATVYAGVAVTSHIDGSLATAVFDNAAVTPAVPPVPDTTAPTVPQNLVATATGMTTVSLTWDASTDAESGIGGYRVFRDGGYVSNAGGTSFNDSGLTPGTTYSYTVSAVDASPQLNESSQSSAQSATTDPEVFVNVPDVVNQAQAVAEALITTAGLSVGTVSTSNSDTVAAGNVISQSPLGSTPVLEGSAVDLLVSLGTTPVTVPNVVGQNLVTATTTLTSAGLVVGTVTRTYSATVSLDAVISQNPGSGVLVANGSAVNLVVSDGPPPPDITPPTVPTVLTATVAGPSQINLSWVASTDTETGVGGYRIYRDGIAISTSVSTNFAATGLNPNTSYVFTVSAVDNAIPANESGQSASVSATTEVAPLWQSQDIGAVAAAGSFAESGGTLTLTASGADIWDAADEFHFAYQTLTGDGEVVARVSSFTASHQWAKAGVMIRESLATNSQHAMMMVTPSGNGAGLHARLSAGSNSTASSGGSGNAPYWVRLVRAGDTLTGSKSADGVTWVEVGQQTIPMSATVYAGVAVTSHIDGSLATAVFDNAAVTPAVPPIPDSTAPTDPTGLTVVAVGAYEVTLSWLASTDTETGVGGYRIYAAGSPIGTSNTTSFTATGLEPNTSYTFTVTAYDRALPVANESGQSASVSATTAAAPLWQSQDIGAVAAAGSLTESGGTLTLTASGADIWDAADEFHFAYQSLTGDGEVVAKVSSFTASHQWAKAGVMIRESLATDSQHAMMMVTPSSNGAGLHARLAAGSNSTATSGGSGNAPYWVRLVRAGDTLTGFKSADGVTWVEVGQQTIPMSATVYAGVAVTSHIDGSLATAAFDSAAVIPGT